MRIIETKVYTFPELSETAKEAARDYARANWIYSDSNDWSTAIEDAVTIGAIVGIEINGRAWTNSHGFKGSEPIIYFDLNRRELAVDAHYQYKKGAAAAVREYAPQDNKLHQIADALQEIQKRHFYQLRATMTPAGRSGMDQRVDVYRYDEKELSTGADMDLSDILTDFPQWILKQLESDYEYQCTEEAVDDMLTAGGYEFDEDGNLI